MRYLYLDIKFILLKSISVFKKDWNPLPEISQSNFLSLKLEFKEI